MQQVLDYSAGYPGAAAIARAGYVGAVRYLRKEGASRVRPITADERADFDRAGLAVALVYQHVSKTRVLEGRGAGQHDARWALARAAEIGIPQPRAIYFAVDADHPPAAVLMYFRGVADVLGVARTGAYGSYRVVESLLSADLTGYAWQTAAWSGGKRSQRAHLFQRIGSPTVGGIAVDINDVLAADWGQHNHAQEDDDVTPDELNKLLLTTPVKSWEQDGTPNTISLMDLLRGGPGHARDASLKADKVLVTVAALQSAVAALASDQDITPDIIGTLINDAVAEHTPTADQVAEATATKLGPALEDLAAKVLAADNVEQAAEIVRQLGAKLAAVAA